VEFALRLATSAPVTVGAGRHLPGDELALPDWGRHPWPERLAALHGRSARFDVAASLHLGCATPFTSAPSAHQATPTQQR